MHGFCQNVNVSVILCLHQENRVSESELPCVAKVRPPLWIQNLYLYFPTYRVGFPCALSRAQSRDGGRDSVDLLCSHNFCKDSRQICNLYPVCFVGSAPSSQQWFERNWGQMIKNHRMVSSSHSPCLLTSPREDPFLSQISCWVLRMHFGCFLFPAVAATAWMLQILGAFKVGLCQQGVL